MGDDLYGPIHIFTMRDITPEINKLGLLTLLGFCVEINIVAFEFVIAEHHIAAEIGDAGAIVM